MERFHTTGGLPPRRKVRKTTSRRTLTTRIPFQERDFIAWDGEGDTEKDTYILFGCSRGDTVSSNSLRATECFDLLIKCAQKYPDTIHCAFAFDYDVTMMCASLPEERRKQLVKNGVTWFNHYRIEYRPKKWFTLTDREQNVRIQIYDMFSFFTCSALKAWSEYLPDEPVYQEVVAGKDLRSTFAYRDIKMIRRYMMLELELYVKLITKLRILLAELGVHPRGWYGPGAVASSVMRKFGIKKWMDRELPDEVIQASQHAYFGGRFEQFYTGRYDGPVYTADIRSAYPDALRRMPALAGGIWDHLHYSTDYPRRTPCVDFSLYKVRYYKGETPDALFSPSPLPLRDARHCVHYPNHVVGWYWGVEVNAAIDGLEPGDRLIIDEAWEFVPANVDLPFQFMEELYHQRQIWKDAKNPIQYAAKLVLNSMYGKLAQRVGWNRKLHTSPTWHQLEWAGFTTAYCRAMIYRAICQNKHTVIAVETDGIFSMVPLSLGEDRKRLGDWEYDQFDGLIYVQSGVYWKREPLGYPLELDYGWTKVKVRGFGPGDLRYDHVMDNLPTLTTLVADTRRFSALRAFWNKPELTHWIEAHRMVVWGGGGKRHHNEELCPKCLGVNIDFHPLAISYPTGGVSVKHVLPWRDDNVNPWWSIADAYDLIQLPTHSTI